MADSARSSVDRQPPIDCAELWVCPVCGYVPPAQYSESPGWCVFSLRGGGVKREFRHPYGDDREPIGYVKVAVEITRRPLTGSQTDD